MEVSSQTKDRPAGMADSLLSEYEASTARLITPPFFSFTFDLHKHLLLLLNVQLMPAAPGTCFLLSRQHQACQPNAFQNMWATWVNDFQPDTIRQCMSRWTWVIPLLKWICCVAYPRAYHKNDVCVQQGLPTVQWYTTVPEINWGPRFRVVSMMDLSNLP